MAKQNCIFITSFFCQKHKKRKASKNLWLTKKLNKKKKKEVKKKKLNKRLQNGNHQSHQIDIIGKSLKYLQFFKFFFSSYFQDDISYRSDTVAAETADAHTDK